LIGVPCRITGNSAELTSIPNIWSSRESLPAAHLNEALSRPHDYPEHYDYQDKYDQSHHQIRHRLHSAPVETALIAYPGHEAPPSKMIIDKAARAEAHRQIESGQHKNDQIQGPTNHRSLRQEQENARSDEEYRAHTLREAMRSRIILDNARSQQVQRQHNPAIEQPVRAY